MNKRCIQCLRAFARELMAGLLFLAKGIIGAAAFCLALAAFGLAVACLLEAGGMEAAERSVVLICAGSGISAMIAGALMITAELEKPESSPG